MQISYITLVNHEQLFSGLVRNLTDLGIDQRAIHAKRGARTIASGYNRAVREMPTEAPLLCFIHQDARLLFDVQTEVPRFYSVHPDAGVLGFVGATVIAPGGAWWLGDEHRGKLLEGSDAKILGPVSGSARVDVVDGYCLFITRNAFEHVGGFDERYQDWHFYDCDLCMKTKTCGFQNYVIDAWTQHLSGGSLLSPWAEEQRRFTEKWFGVGVAGTTPGFRASERSERAGQGPG